MMNAGGPNLPTKQRHEGHWGTDSKTSDASDASGPTLGSGEPGARALRKAGAPVPGDAETLGLGWTLFCSI